jgi:hypothetical protein
VAAVCLNPLVTPKTHGEAQQQGRTSARVHDRRYHKLAAEVDRSSCVPLVRIEVVRQRWPLFGRQTTLNAAT